MDNKLSKLFKHTQENKNLNLDNKCPENNEPYSTTSLISTIPKQEVENDIIETIDLNIENNNKNQSDEIDPLELESEYLYKKILKEIIKISDNKKNYIELFMLNCYEIMSEIDGKIEKEKLFLLQLLEEKLLKEKTVYRFEKQSIIFLFNFISI